MTDLSKINLNLLYALDALLQHCHVTQAANALNISQAAMSASLKQLREIFKDKLLVRGQYSQMQLTPLANSLKKPVRVALEQIQSVFTGNIEFDCQTSTRQFHLGMSDYIAFVLMPKLMAYLNQHAPKIQIIQHAINYIDSMLPFEQDGLDIIIGNFPNVPGSIVSQGLFTDESVIVADQHHPIFNQKKITLASIARYPQSFVSLESKAEKNFIYEFMLQQGYKPPVALFTPHTLISLYALTDTNIIAHSVRRLAEPIAELAKLKLHAAPYQNQFPKYHAKQYWHPRVHDDPGHQWLRQLIQKLASAY